MPETSEPLSLTINNARTQLLDTLQRQLATCIADKITPQMSGVPFINIGKDPAQITAIKKVINALYHAEEALKQWESIDASTISGKALAVKQGVSALNQAYKALSQLNEASPEIQSIIVDNYYLLEPVFSGVYDAINQSGWISEFSKMETPAKANTIINKGSELLGPDMSQWNSQNPLIDCFFKLSQAALTIGEAADNGLLDEKRRELAAKAGILIEELKNNPLFQKMSAQDIEESKAVKDLFSWFENIEEDDFKFTQESIKTYISWSNHYLPVLLETADQFERQNYLRSGLLTHMLSESMDKLSQVVNNEIATSSLEIAERVLPVSSHAAVREQKIELGQMKDVQEIVTTQNSKKALTAFFEILANYKGKSFSDIIENDRIRLRQIYPDIQYALAHTDFELENNLANLLNTEGPEKEAEPVIKPWWQRAAGYVTSFVVSGEIDKALTKESDALAILDTKIATTQLKVTVAEQAREHLNPDAARMASLDARVLSRINSLAEKLPAPAERAVVQPGDLVPVKASSLHNLRGNITYLQELKLSRKLYDTGRNITSLIRLHMSEENRAYFSSPPYEINPYEPELVGQIKTVENALFSLIKALHEFEQIPQDFGIANKVQMLAVITKAGLELKQSVTVLSPAARQVLAPVLNQLNTYSASLSGIDSKSSNLSELGLLNQMDDNLPLEMDKTSSVPVKPISEKKADEEEPTNYDAYADDIAAARKLLLSQFSSTLAEPLARLMNPQPDGVPFIDFENEPPQVVAIKKVVNCMYYTELSLRTWHKMNFDAPSVLDKVVLAHQGAVTLSNVYKAITLIGNSSSELHSVVVDNYHIIEPLLTGVSAVIKGSGWVNEFTKLDTLDKTSAVITKGTELFGTDMRKWNNSNPLVETFSKLSQVMTATSEVADKSLSQADQQEKMVQIISLIAELEANPFFQKITVRGLEESKAVKDLFAWFKNIQADDFQFTQQSIEKYISWANEHLPALVMAADQLERQNYLKSGLLTEQLLEAADNMAQTVNKELDSSSFLTINERLIPSSSLISLRKKNITLSQINDVQEIANGQKNNNSVTEFFAILAAYKGKSFSDILESDRVRLRQIYPDIQNALAHADFELENKLTVLLNTAGPKSTLSTTQNASDATNSEIDKALAKENVVIAVLDKRIAAARLKVSVAELALEHLNEKKHLEHSVSLDDRVSSRIDSLMAQLPSQKTQKKVVQSGDIAPVKASSLNNFRGNVAYLQELRLSEKVQETRKNVSTLIERHLSKEDQAYFSVSPYVLNADEPEWVKQIKAVENALYYLQDGLSRLENTSDDFGIGSKTQMLLAVGDAGLDLKKSINVIYPTAYQILSPVLNQLNAYSSLDGADSKSSEQLRQLDTTLPQEQKLAEVAQQDSAAKKTGLPLVEQQQEEEKESVNFEEYADNIASARTRLLDTLDSRLSEPLTRMLKPQPNGVPFIDFEDEPPKVVSMKKVINSMYYAESALRTWHKMNFDSTSVFDRVVLAHQGATALSNAYRTITLLGETSPELSKFIQEKYDFIEPMYKAIDRLAKSTGWNNSLSAVDVAKNVGSYLGQGLNFVQPENNRISKSQALVNMLADLPLLMNRISKRIDPNVETNEDEIQMTQGQIESIGKVATLFIEGRGSIFNVFRGPHALISLVKLSSKLNKEGDTLQDTTIKEYQQWVEEEYPRLLLLIDEIEVRNAFKPGTLSAVFITEVDAINRKLNEVIEEKLSGEMINAIQGGKMDDPEHPYVPVLASKLQITKLTDDFVTRRDEHFKQMNRALWPDAFKNELQQKTGTLFFDILRNYEDKPFTKISKADLAKLRIAFAKIQDPLSFADLDLANELLSTLNHLETSAKTQQKEAPFTVAQLLALEEPMQTYLKRQYKTFELNTAVIEDARNQLDPLADKQKRFDLDQEAINKARADYFAKEKQMPVPEPGKLEPVEIASTNTMRGSFSKLQDLKLSSYVELMRDSFRGITKDKMSPHIQAYLEKPDGVGLHIIHENDPAIPRHIKRLENGLYHLEEALKRVEQLDRNDAALHQFRLLLEIENELMQIKKDIDNLSPELKLHYGPLMKRVVDFSAMVQNIDYNKEDTNELKEVLSDAKKDLLKLNNKPSESEKIDAEQEQKQTPGIRAMKLGIKYLHMSSPQMERARSYLLTKYGHSFTPQPLSFRSFSREQLSDQQFMLGEVHRLNAMLDNAGYFDLKKINVIIDLTKQVMRVGSQASELFGMVNKLIKDEYVHLKEASYQDFITALSREEDYLCLKPGTLVNQGMTLLNQLFLSAALELDMPFDEKLKLLDDAHYIRMVLKETENDLLKLEEQLENDPSNADLPLNIAIKKDKIAFFQNQINLYQTKDKDAIKSTLLDYQFEVDLRNILANSFLINPIIDQYEDLIRKSYTKNKMQLLNAADTGKELSNLLNTIENQNIGNYLIVSKAIKKLSKFGTELPESNQFVKDYLMALVSSLSNDEIPIQTRAEYVKSLPKDPVFVNTINLAVKGQSFLTKFKEFIERITQCFIEGLTTGVNIIARYYEIKLAQKMDNIEKSLQFKSELNATIGSKDKEENELKSDEEIEQQKSSEDAPIDEDDESADLGHSAGFSR